MRKLWIAFIVLASVGSIYPFNFQTSELNAVMISAFLQSCCRISGRGDILGNVILFVPIGFTGMLAVRRDHSAIRRFLFVCVVGGITAFLLQVMQIFLPSRDENLQDVFWNLLGIAAGVVGALVAIVLWWTADRYVRWQEGALLVLLFGTLALTWTSICNCLGRAGRQFHS